MSRSDEDAFHNPTEPGGSGGDEAEGRRRGPAARDKILLLAADWQLWRDQDGAGYCTIEVDGHLEHLRLQSRAFRDHVTRAYGAAYKVEVDGREVPQGFTDQAFQDARRSLEAQAMVGPEHVPWHRVGAAEDMIVLDLGSAEWRMVQITADGWEVVERCPVKMVRTPGMRPLPMPEPGGSLDSLKDLLNFGHVAADRKRLSDDQRRMIREQADRSFRLYIGAEVGALAPSLSRFILCVSGEHGSGKSTVASAFKQLVDPHRAMRRSLPQNSEDLFIAAAQTHCLLFDNISDVAAWVADDLSRMATGGSLGKRTKFSDTEETYITVRCPIVLNGIPDLTTRADLADRALALKLPAIPDEHRRDDAEIETDLRDLAPSVLGVLLDGVAAALRNRDEIAELMRERPSKPRMLDATIWAEAAGEAFGWPRWQFLTDVLGNRLETVEVALEADSVAEAVRQFMKDKARWKGQARPLLDELAKHINERTLKSKGWPRTGHHLSTCLRRSQPGLRRIGLEVEFTRDSAARWIEITKETRPDEDRAREVEGAG